MEVDLSTKTFSVYNVTDEERKMYLGGKGLGLKLLFDRLSPGIDPLGPYNIIAFMPGVLMATGAPCSGRFAAVTKSPQTGLMASATCGGPFGMQLKTAGWDGLLIKGKSETPLYLVVNAEGVEFKDASHIWGKGAIEAQEELGKKVSALAIGPAGENLVRFANVASSHRYLGRAGMGAVLGSKKLKAIQVIGKEYKIVPKDKETFDKIRKLGLKRLKGNPVTAYALRKYGTPSLVNHSNVSGMLPVRNFQLGTSPDAYTVTGEYMSEKYETKNDSCRACAILCGKKGNFQGESMAAPEYETIGLLGTNLQIFDAVQIAKWNKLCGDLGVDTMSTGSTIAWVMEATEKGLVESNLKFGSPEGVAEAIEDIAYCRGLGADMALGTRALAEKYGGAEFAMHVKGLEIAAYDPRASFGLGLGYAVANRGGCHLSSTLMANEIFLGYLEPYATYAKADWVKFQEDLFCCINSIQTCIFTTFGYIFENPITKYSAWLQLKWVMQYLPKNAIDIADVSVYQKLWSSITGIKISRSEFIKAGERIHILERYMNTREGVSVEDDTLPARLLYESRECDTKKRSVPLAQMRKRYYKLRGYDRVGRPQTKKMQKLGIELR